MGTTRRKSEKRLGNALCYPRIFFVPDESEIRQTQGDVHGLICVRDLCDLNDVGGLTVRVECDLKGLSFKEGSIETVTALETITAHTEPELRDRAGRAASVQQFRSRAPLRLGLAGGGTDLSSYSEAYGGAVLNATIDRFAYTHLTFLEGREVRFRASDIGVEEVFDLASSRTIQGELILHHAVYNRIVREFLHGQAPSVELSTTVDAPPGSGLGSSSALVVALVEAFRAAFSLPLGPYDVAQLAYQIERVDLKLAGGKQDQYAAAFGGVNFIEFLPRDRVIVNPLRVPRSALNELEAALVVCFTGQSRHSNDIIREQLRGVHAQSAATIEGLHQLKADAVEMKGALLSGDLRDFAEILNRSWIAKQKTARGIANEGIGALYDLAIAKGAWGGKVSGAGGGGFMMFVTDPENRYRLTLAIRAAGVDAHPVHFVNGGAETWTAQS